MNTRRARQYAFLAGMLTMVACWGGYWLISSHAGASVAQERAVIAQVVIGGVLALWCWRHSARLDKAAGPDLRAAA